MPKFKITYRNEATEIVEAGSITEAAAIRVYTKHPVSKIRRMAEVTRPEDVSCFFLGV